MASFTQLRISQLSGSFGTAAGQINDLQAPLAREYHSGSQAGASLADHLSHVVSSLKRIHGAAEFSSATAGEFSQTIVPSSDAGSNLGSASKEWGQVHTNAIHSAAALDVNITTGLTMDATTVSIDGTDDSNVTVTGSAKDLDIAVAGGGTQELRLASAGTGASALHLNASAGGLDLDSADMITLDAADEITLTTTSADGHISLVTAHTSGVAFHIDANADAASEVQIDAGILDVDVTGAATMDAGGSITLTGAAGILLAGGSSEIDITNSGAFDVNVGSVDLDSTAGIAMDGTTVSIDGTDDSNVTVTGSAKDLDIAVAGGGTQELRLASAGTGASALHLNASAGGLDLDSADMITLDAADEITLTTSSADGHVSLVSAHTAGVAIHLDGDAAAGSIVDIDAGILDVDVTGVASIDSGGTLSLATANSGVAVSIGHATSEVTVNDNLTVTGDLTVSGTTVTLDTTNLLVEDPIVVLNKANSSANGQGGIAIELGGSSLDMVFGRVANDTWGVGTKDTSGGTVTTVADMTLGALRAGKLEIDGSDEYIDVSSNTMTLTATAGITLDAATDIVLDADGDDITFKAGSGDSTGLKWSQSGSGDWTNLVGTSDKDLIFQVNDGGSATEVMRLDGDVSALLMASSKKIMLGAAEEYVYGDGTDIHFGVGSGGDVNLPSSIGLTFGDDGEKIEGDGSGLTIAGGSLTLDSEADINIDAGGADIIFKDDGTEFGRIIKSSSNMLLSGAIGDIVLDPAGGNVVPSADSADSLGSDAVSASHSAGSSQSGLTSGLTSGQSFSMSGNDVAILYGSSLSAPSGGSAPSGFTTSVVGSVSLSSFSSTFNGLLSLGDGGSYSGGTISAGTILSLNGSSSSFFFVVLADYSGGSSMSICAMANVSGHTTSIGSVSSISSYSSSGFSGSGAISGVSVSADDVVAYTFSGGTAIFEAVTAITSSTPWGFVANPNSAVSGLSTFSSSGSPSSVTSGGTITAAASVVAWANIFVDNVDLNGQGKVYLDADQNMKIEPVSSTGVKITGNIDNAASVHLVGYGMTFDGGDQNDSFLFNNSAIALEAITAPSSTTGKLYNVTGSLVWNGNVITPRSQKISYTVTASHPSNVHTGLVIAGLSHDLGVNSLNSDVFLNGQLMLSGASGASGDYILSGSASALAFHFALEADDVVTVVTLG